MPSLHAQWSYRDGAPAGHKIAYGNGVFASVPEGGSDGGVVVQRSSDGENWESTTQDFDGFVDSLNFVNDRFVLTTQEGGGGIYSSDNAGTFDFLLGHFPGFPIINDIAFANSTWVAVGGGASSRNIVVTADFDSVERPTLPDDNFSYQRAVVFGDDVWVSLSDATGSVYSENGGTTWETLDLPTTPDGYQFAEATYVDGQFVAIANDFGSSEEDNALLFTSDDGINWTLTTRAYRHWHGMTYADGEFVLVASTSDGDVVLAGASVDSLTEEALPAEIGAPSGIAYGEGLWMVLDAGGGAAVKGTYSGDPDDGLGSDPATTPAFADVVGAYTSPDSTAFLYAFKHAAWLFPVEVSETTGYFYDSVLNYWWFTGTSLYPWVFIFGDGDPVESGWYYFFPDSFRNNGYRIFATPSGGFLTDQDLR